MNSLFPPPVFNSLGSNYSFGFALAALKQLWLPSRSAPGKLQQVLAKEFSGSVVLTYKGRDAIELALRLIGAAEHHVITQAFTCHAIEAAIVRAGAEPIYADLAPGQLNPDATTLEAARASAPKAKAVIIQHTLGVPADISAIAEWCKQQQLVLIEDIASAVGGVDADGVSLGHFGDVTVLSFGRDKVVDAVSGGALVVRNSQLQKKLAASSGQAMVAGLRTVPAIQRFKDLLYPTLTRKIRWFHKLLLGKVVFRVARLVGWLSSPIASPLSEPAALPASHAALALRAWRRLQPSIQHRRRISQVYDQMLPGSIKLVTAGHLTRSSLIRYSIQVPEPDQLAKFLSTKGFYLTDRWYRQAVDFGRLKYTTQYQLGSCPEAEQLTKKILNLPTHQAISASKAQELSEYINQYLSTDHA